jgi:hypothetical protein
MAHLQGVRKFGIAVATSSCLTVPGWKARRACLNSLCLRAQKATLPSTDFVQIAVVLHTFGCAKAGHKGVA